MSLPKGVEIAYHPKRLQPYTVWVPGNWRYAIGVARSAWFFAKTQKEAEQFVSKYVVPTEAPEFFGK